MLQQINEVPENIVGFRATGEVTMDDYEKVLIPGVDKFLENHKELRYLFVIETDIKNFKMGAFLDDIKLGIKHITQWEKMAIVSDQDGVNKFTETVKYIVPGQAKSFTLSQVEDAKKWTSE